MKMIIGLIGLICMITLTIPAIAGDTYVNGYYKQDGTYVAPHWRSSPDSRRDNNWSSKGNFNPYTGKQGTQDPYDSDSNVFHPRHKSGVSMRDSLDPNN